MLKSNTDLMYFRLSHKSVNNCVPEEFKASFFKDKLIWMPAEACPKHKDNHPRKRRGVKDGPFLLFATKYKCPVPHSLNVEAISFANGPGYRNSQLIDILNFDIINGGSRCCYNLTVSASFRVSLLFAWRRL